MSPCHLNFPVLTVAVDPRGPSSFSAPQRLSSRRRRGSAVQSVCPASAQRRVFTRFPHPVLTLAVLSCSFCTQTLAGAGGGGGEHPAPAVSWRQQEADPEKGPREPQPCALRAALSGVQAAFPYVIDTTFEAHWIHCTRLSA